MNSNNKSNCKKRIVRLREPAAFMSFSSVGGREELLGPIGEKLDLFDPADRFGQKTWEMSEGEMCRLSLNIAMKRAGVSHTELDLIIAGDLQNQCVASALGLSSFGIPYLSIYGACSTCTEGLLMMSSYINGLSTYPSTCDNGGTGQTIFDVSSTSFSPSLSSSFIGACVTSSHNCAAERQFRSPVEYGSQRTPTAQWTATAAASFILCGEELMRKQNKKSSFARISEIMPGRIVDGVTSDGANMGAAMSFAAFDSIMSYFAESGERPENFDYIVTGDLGEVGSEMLRELLAPHLPSAASRHTDCGLLLYDEVRQDRHSGASGCGTSASILAAHFLPMLERGDLGSILFLSTGALMSPSSVLQGNSILGIAPLIRIDRATL